jgi:hypothetical protein
VSEALVRRWFEQVWNEAREDAVDAMFARDGIAHGLPEDVRGPEGFKGFQRAFLSAFPGMRVEVDEVLEGAPAPDGTVTVSVRFTAFVARGGREGAMPCMCLARWRDGQIREAWNVCDFLALQRQVGELPL